MCCVNIEILKKYIGKKINVVLNSGNINLTGIIKSIDDKTNSVSFVDKYDYKIDLDSDSIIFVKPLEDDIGKRKL